MNWEFWLVITTTRESQEMKQTKVFSEEVSMKSRCSWRVGILIGILVATVVGIFCTGIIKITHTKIPFLTGLIT